MTLFEIKDIIVERLGKLTIDEIYFADSRGLAKNIFEDVTGCKTDTEIEAYLSSAFNDTTFVSKKFKHEQIAIDFKNSIETCESDLKLCDENNEAINRQRNEALLVMKTGHNSNDKIKLELKEMETELSKSELLKNKSVYKEQVLKYDDRKKEVEAIISENEKLTAESHNKLNPLRKKEIANEKEGLALRKKLKKLKILKTDNEKLFKLVPVNDSSYYTDEYSALEFLYFILTGFEINISEDNTIEAKTKPVLRKYKVANDKVFDFTVNHVIYSNCIPKGWREILKEIILIRGISFKGILNYNSSKGIYVDLNDMKLSIMDYEFMLALQIAATDKLSFIMADNKILLPLSGGVIAILSIRER